MSRTKTKTLTVHIPLALAKRIDLAAARLEQSHGWVMKQALSAWVAQEEARAGLTPESEESVDSQPVSPVQGEALS